MIDKILVAINNTPSAMHAANYAIALSKKLNAKVGVVYVTQRSIGNIDAGVMPITAEKELQQQHDVLLDELNRVYPETELEEFNPIGNPEKEVLNLIELWRPNLLVIGHHTHGFFQKWFGHHTDQHLIKHIQIPLLIIPKTYPLV